MKSILMIVCLFEMYAKIRDDLLLANGNYFSFSRVE